VRRFEVAPSSNSTVINVDDDDNDDDVEDKINVVCTCFSCVLQRSFCLKQSVFCRNNLRQ
jgi:hypothetical protein